MRSVKTFTAGLAGALALSFLCSAGPSAAAYAPVAGRIMTRWAKDVRPEAPLPEYPRPQMTRTDWLNLNGLWNYAITPKGASRPASFDGVILVPFAAESALSGVGKKVGGKNELWYEREFEVPAGWRGRKVLLHFGAVDWEAEVWLNGKELGSHKGGYDAFSFDITKALAKEGPQKLTVRVWDPTDQHTQPRGKQVDEPGGIMYTAVTGIWQTVWLEPVADRYIDSFKITPDIDAGQAVLEVSAAGRAKRYTVEAVVKDGGTEVSRAEGGAGERIVLPIKNARLWSPDSPFLYDLSITLKDRKGGKADEVGSYFGMRKISLGKDKAGLTRIMLNNEFVFQFGPLDQGWWPDGLYTAPTDEALRYDIEFTKKLGFNMARKHVKTEPARWYHWCDKLGLLVWQDMPSGDKFIGARDPDIKRSRESEDQFRLELRRMIGGYYNHPSIVVWVPFNEGWGQFKTTEIAEYTRGLDPTRLIDSVSGWADRLTGDMHDIHVYPGPEMPNPEEKRAVVLGEFGGLGLPVAGHTWQEKKNWGYKSFKDVRSLTEAYSGLISKLHPLIDKGLSAAVYTQTTDVEIEVNGLATYDRAVDKMDAEQVARINDGYFQPEITAPLDIFIDSIEVSISNPGGSGAVRYTVDGTDPDENSALYKGPIRLTGTAEVRARTFWPGDYASGVSALTVTRTEPADPVRTGKVEPGLKYEYFEYPDVDVSSVKDLKKLAPKMSGIAPTPELSAAKASEYFGMTFEGLVEVPNDGLYTFYTTSDDGSTLYVGGKQIVANDYFQAMTERSGVTALKAGLHRIRAEYFQGARGFGLEVRYEGPGVDKQLIPAAAFYHE